MKEEIFFTVLSLLIVLFAKYKKIVSPASIIVVWWGIWLFISDLDSSILFKPSDYTYILFLTMLISFSLGSLFVRVQQNIFINNLSVSNNLINFFNKTYIVVLFICTFYFLKAMSILETRGIEGYRALTFSSPDHVSILFGNPYIEIIYDMLVPTYEFFYLIVGITFYIHKIDKKIFYLSIIMVFLGSLMRLGRFGIYYIIILLSIAFLLKIKNKYLTRKSNFKLIFLAALILITIGGVRGNSFLKSFTNSLINYHTVGFTLFSLKLENPNSSLNENITYGEGVISGLNYLATLALRRIFPDYNPKYLSQVTAGFNKPVEAGINPETGYPVYYNAFYTILYSLYSDGRIFAVILVPFIIGYILGNAYLDYKVHRNLISFFIILLIMHLMIFSLFSSIFDSPKWWISIIIVTIIKNKKTIILFFNPSKKRSFGSN